MRTVTFTRTELALAVLTITNDPTQPYHLPEEGFSEPEFDNRQTFADESPHVGGALLTQSVVGLGTLALTIYTHAADAATLKAQKRALEACVRQFSYTAALTIVGDPDTYTCLPGRISWGEVDSGMVAALMARAVVTIPVQPLGA